MKNSAAAGAALLDAAALSRIARNANVMSMLRHIRIKRMPNTVQLWFGDTHIATVELDSWAGSALQAFAADLPGVLASDHVIAAAPALLEALRLTRISRGWQYMSPETQAIIAAALSKAEGPASEDARASIERGEANQDQEA